MGRILSAILFVIAFAAAPHTATAVGKITVDPNVPGAESPEDVSKPDTRVAEKITYQARKKTVLAILTDLSELTGVTLKAGYNNKDWQVRDRKMNIFATDVPLAQVMNSICLLYTSPSPRD